MACVLHSKIMTPFWRSWTHKNSSTLLLKYTYYHQMIQRKHTSPVICLWNLRSVNILSQKTHVSLPSPFHSHSHQSHLQLPRSANQVHSQSQGQHDPSPPLFCDVLLHLFVAGWGWGVVVFRGAALSQAHKVVDIAVMIFGGDQLSLTVNIHKQECLVKRLLCCIQGQGHSEGSEQCLPRQYLWSAKLSMVMHHQPENHSEISFCYVQGQSHNRFY